jgi:hypothetical protein
VTEYLAEIGESIREINLFLDQEFFRFDVFIDLPVKNIFYDMKKNDAADHKSSD